MPLTNPRPGLFRARADKRLAWHVISPNAEKSVEELEREWHSLYDKTNPSRARRVARHVLPWIAAIATLFGIASLIVPAETLGSPFSDILPIGLAIACVVGALFAALIAYLPFATPYVAPHIMHDSLLELRPEVVGWANDETPVADIWRVQRALFELEQIQDAAFHWRVGIDEEAIAEPEWASASIVKPFLIEQLVARADALVAVAQGVDFPVPPSLLSDVAKEASEQLSTGGSTPPGSVVSDTV
ncbi:hypothetical protein HDC94_001227 [Leifsonia sp. AK011]|uniref:hypothetical protein n=1 Tax=Leifsonia sp. AK011 TaxID=2723075 RepID=UPI0015C72D07|nr:hypothetical protein [Leifsonia sp. AK011]NYF10071.1 hypothetical protein [Leifsonia sp. AK011]